MTRPARQPRRDELTTLTHSAPAISRRLSTLSESAPAVVDARARALRAAGRDVIGFGAGEPDFPTADHIIDAAAAEARHPRNHRYTPAGGLPELKALVASVTRRDSGFDVDPAQVVITNGGKQAVFNALAAVIDPGDEVILPTPYWTTYPESIRLSGGVPVPVIGTAEAGYHITVDQLERARTPRTKALIFNSPSNPTGAVYDPAEVAAIGRWANDAGLWVISDEIYQHYTYGTAKFTSIAPEVPSRCIIVNGLAKSYAMPGWRVGWLTAPPAIARAITNFQSHCTGNVSNLSQRAAIAALEDGLGVPGAMRVQFERRRAIIVEILSSIPGVVVPVPEGAFYVYPDVSRLLAGTSIRGRTPRTSIELAELILDEADVALVPGEAFGPSGYLRISYALAEDQLVEGASRIKALLEQ